MLLAPVLTKLFGKGGDVMMMIAHWVRESPEWHPTGLLLYTLLVKINTYTSILPHFIELSGAQPPAILTIAIIFF